ncbi:MAG TPA: hypothetical protein PKA64_14395 [Myxococcota bacterium]|nr:hypothetical protein [Myxococcota bacterium]
MRSLALLPALLLPHAALADCVYTGAKRAYIECIYESVLDVAADVLGLGDRQEETEIHVNIVQDSVVELDETFDLAIAGHTSRLDGLDADVDLLDASVTAIGDQVLELDEEFDLRIAGHTSRLDALESAVAELSSDLVAAQSEVLALQGDVADHDARLAAEETAGLRSAWISGNSGAVSIAQQHGTFLSGITKLSAGAYRVSVAPGAFSSTPHCFCAPFHYGGHSNMICNVSQVNTSVIDVLATDVAGALQDRDVWLFCMQP